jgi:talin
LEYKNKIRQLRVRTLDGGALKTISVDESQPVSQLMVVICSKMGITNHDEYSLVRGPLAGTDDVDGYTNGYSRDKERERERSPYYNGNSVMNTIGRKKEKQIQQLRFARFLLRQVL